MISISGLRRSIAVLRRGSSFHLRAGAAQEFERSYRRMIGGRGDGDAPDAEAEPEAQVFTLLSDQAPLNRVLAERERQREREQPRARRPALRQGRDEAPPLPQVTSRMLLLGMAGSGKTMTLRYAALCLADAYLKRDARLLAETLDLHVRPPPLPIYVRLTQFAEELPHDTRELPRAERDEISGAAPELFLDWLDRRAAPSCCWKGCTRSTARTARPARCCWPPPVWPMPATAR